MALFVPLDVDYASDPKVLRAGAHAELLYIRSLCLAKRRMEDGHIESVQLAGLCLGIPGRPALHAESLVLSGLWEKNGDGWYIAAWLKRNASAETVKQQARRQSEHGSKGAHIRWHTIDEPSPTCRYCMGNGWVTP